MVVKAPYNGKYVLLYSVVAAVVVAVGAKFPPALQALQQLGVDPSFGLAGAVGLAVVDLLAASVVSGSAYPASGSASPA